MIPAAARLALEITTITLLVPVHLLPNVTISINRKFLSASRSAVLSEPAGKLTLL